MSTPDPTRSTDTAAQALNELAAATRKDAVADQTLAGLAAWHATQAPQTSGGRQPAHEAAQIRENAAALSGQAGAHVDVAWAHNGQIVWPRAADADSRTGFVRRRVAGSPTRTTRRRRAQPMTPAVSRNGETPVGGGRRG